MANDPTLEATRSDARAVEDDAWSEDPSSRDALAKALQELEVHQVELEMQNQELREAQTALGLAHDRYRALFDESLVGLVLVSSKGVVLDANRAATSLFERPLARLVGKPLVVCLDNGYGDAFYRHVEAVLESKVPQNTELGVRQTGTASRTVVVRSCVLSEPGEILCHFTDVTDQRAALKEKEAMEQRLHEAEKLEAVGRVAANIAHDVNNVLVSVIGLGEFVRSEVTDPAVGADIESLLEAAWRGARLMRGLLGLSRRSQRPSRVIDLVNVVDNVVGMSRRKKPRVCLVWEKPQEACCVRGDEEELTQALLNVAINAIDATDDGSVTFTCRCVSGDGPDPCVEVTIVDTGAGMSDEIRSRVFEPLFTTKAQRGGTGLGMTQVRATVDAHRGTVEVTSSIGQGTKVTIALPHVAQAPELDPVGVDVMTFGRPLSILFVDDDDTVRRSATRQLRAAGAEISVFRDARSVLDALRRQPNLADVAIVDVDMPGMSGPELVHALFEQVGPLPIVFVTGASGGEVPAELLRRRYVRLARKPWTRSELIHAVLAVVDGKAEALRTAPPSR